MFIILPANHLRKIARGTFLACGKMMAQPFTPGWEVYYTETVGIYIGFDKGWCKAIFEAMPEQSTADGQYFKAAYKDYEEFPAVWFETKGRVF